MISGKYEVIHSVKTVGEVSTVEGSEIHFVVNDEKTACKGTVMTAGRFGGLWDLTVKVSTGGDAFKDNETIFMILSRSLCHGAASAYTVYRKMYEKVNEQEQQEIFPEMQSSKRFSLGV